MASIVLGIVALTQIRRTREKGTGLAIGGMAATAAWLLVIAVIVAALIAYDSGPSRTGDAEITDAGDISVEDLAVGDCLLEMPGGGRILDVPGVPCSEPHVAEVYATFDLPDGSWPGESAVFTQAEDGCFDRLRDFPTAYNDQSAELYYLYPTEGSWRVGDQEIVCMVEYMDGTRTGSLLD